MIIDNVMKHKHTEAYDDWLTIGNNNYTFHDIRTFGFKFMSPCTKISSNTVFRNNIKKNFNCVGKWCKYVDNQPTWSCKAGRDDECYHVEHIIDRGGPEFTDDNCNKEIAANMVMSWSKWNTDLGKLYYDSNINEKTEIYTDDMMRMARYYIKTCNPGCEQNWSNRNDINLFNDQTIIISFANFMMGIVVIFLSINIMCILCKLYCSDAIII